MAETQARASDRPVEGFGLKRLAVKLWPGKERRAHARKWLAAVDHLRTRTRKGWARDRVSKSKLKRRMATWRK